MELAATNRRGFLTQAQRLAAILRLAALGGLSAGASRKKTAFAAPAAKENRGQQAYRVREKAAARNKDRLGGSIAGNGDDERYANRIASFTKALPHDELGEVDPDAYKALLQALASGDSASFEKVPTVGQVKLANPQASFSFGLVGLDSHATPLVLPPAFSSAEQAADMAELYWQSLTRDVHFSEYESNPLILKAVDDLNRFSDCRIPKEKGKITPRTIFRGHTAGDAQGPYISQYLLASIPFGSSLVKQQYRTVHPGDDFLASYEDWLATQRGIDRAYWRPTATAGKWSMRTRNNLDFTYRYIRNSRDLTVYVHHDFPYMPYLNAGLMLLAQPGSLSSHNPYSWSRVQDGFNTFGSAAVLDLLGVVTDAGLRASWYHKWLLHRRLRPEAFGGRIHNHALGKAKYPIHAEMLNSAVLKENYDRFSSYLLTSSYPEGSPVHPSYPAGHAVIAGACVTVLKAFFTESRSIQNPVIASEDGLSLRPYTGAPLRVGDELNKLASNISIGRNAAGIHYRSDGVEGMALGEAVAIGVLTDLTTTWTEDFAGFSFTKFDGQPVTVRRPGSL